MNEYVDVDIIENGKVIGTTKVLHVTKEPETQNIKLEKVGAKTAYDNLLIKYAELEKEIRLLGERCNQLLKDKGYLTDKIADIKANCDLAIEGRDIKIMELEKENAELESAFRICEKNADTYYDQLTKAKNHIKQLLDCLKQDTNDPQTNYYVCQYMDKAEQFLKEIEK